MLHLLLVVGSVLPIALAQGGLYECPLPWIGFGEKCYKFEMVPADLQQAKKNCEVDGASLLSINTRREHDFVKQWLNSRSPTSLTWFTSGLKEFAGQQGQEITFQWEGDGVEVQGTQFWLPQFNFKDPKNPATRIAYKNDGSEWGWTLLMPENLMSYVCEISKAESYKILAEKRDFNFGVASLDEVDMMRGPQFVVEPRDIIFEKVESKNKQKLQTVSFECEAEGNPQPEYKWYLYKQQVRQEVLPENSPKFAVGNRRLTIDDPQDGVDNGEYECEAYNSIGAVLSRRAILRFGYLNNFPDTHREAVVAYSYRGEGVECDPPKHGYSAISFSWYKDNPSNFIFTDMKPHCFISKDGKLYFQHVTRDDVGSYTCIVIIPGIKSGGKTSQPIPLRVIESGNSHFEPDIVNGFPKVFPSTPVQGDNITIECVAYGTGILVYSWARIDGYQMPVNHKLQDNNRVLYLPNVQVEHGGTYKCIVRRELGQTDEQAVIIDIKARPFFTIQLSNQHVDENSDMTWRCYGYGKPAVEYRWWRNAKELRTEDLVGPDKEKFTINDNVLTLKGVTKKDAAMFQCSARNTFGDAFTGAQLRVLGFAPSFAKHPLPPNIYASQRGTVTIFCQPEAAPTAELVWSKDNRLLNPSTAIDARVQVMPNGNLHIQVVEKGDAGTYKCSATNMHGEAASSGNLTVLAQTKLSFGKTDDVTIAVNKTAFIRCDAAFNPTFDLTYDWYHNNYDIEFERIEIGSGNVAYFVYDPHFIRGTGINNGGLYVINAQLWHAGDYTCVIKATSNELRSTTLLRVVGPPSPPAGLAGGTDITTHTINLSWWPSSDNGGFLTSYVVDGFDQLEGYWRTIKTNINAPRTSEKVEVMVDGLSPGSRYKFRVRAVNEYGIGVASDATEQVFTTREDVPEDYPKELGGGGGKVGELQMHWLPLTEAQYNGKGVGYDICHKPIDGDEESWDCERLLGAKVSTFAKLVGSKLFYKEYSIRIRALNNAGVSKIWSPTVIIRSAEGMPVAVPQDVQAVYFNSTAIEVVWMPVEDSIAAMRGVLKGYRVNYWRRDEEDSSMAQFREFQGQNDHGNIIGLYPNTYYTVTVQTFNSAGLSSISEEYSTRTLRAAPLEAPQEVKLHLSGPYSVEVEWRGVSTSIEEEPLEGYMVRYWKRGENIYVATDIDAEKKARKTIVNLEQMTMYELRVYGYSRGGIGLQSSPTMEFVLGRGCKIAEDSPDKQYVYKCEAGAGQLRVPTVLVVLLTILSVAFSL